MKKYLKLAGSIEVQIKRGTLKSGDRLPSVREIHRNQDVSISTVLKSMDHLCSKGLIKSREKSGYYVTYDHTIFNKKPIVTHPAGSFNYKEIEHLIDAVYVNPVKTHKEVDFSIGVPSKELLPVNKIKKAVIEVMHQSADAETTLEPMYGNTRLRRLITQRAMLWGGNLNFDEVITTNGCMSALAYALKACTKPGEVIITESPMYFGVLQLANSMGLHIIEAMTHSSNGIVLSEVESILKKNSVKVIITVSNFGNPMGFCMPEENKRALVKLANKYDVIVIEEDLYGDVYFGSSRPKTCKNFDGENRVILCSSFSKTLVPGYRVGYVVGAKFARDIARFKVYHSVAANSLTHEVVARVLETGRYDRYLGRLRNEMENNLLKYLEVINRSFPGNTKVSTPQGGFVLWLELDKRVDTNLLFARCLDKCIRIAPGRLFSLRNQYRNCLRLTYGLTWSKKVESAIATIGAIAKEMIKAA